MQQDQFRKDLLFKYEPTRFSLEDKKRIEETASQGINDIELIDLVDLYDINLDNTSVSPY